MRTTIIFFAIVHFCLLTQAQNNPLVGSIPQKEALLGAAKTDSQRIQLLLDISFLDLQTRTDSSVAYARRAYEEAGRINNQWGMEWALIELGIGMRYLANYPKAMDCELKSMQIAEKLDDTKGLEYSYSFLGAIAQDQGYFETALANLNRSNEYARKSGEVFLYTANFAALVFVYADIGKLDSALYWRHLADSMDKKYSFFWPHVPYGLAYVYEIRRDYPKAIEFYRLSGQYGIRNHYLRDILRSYTAIGRIQMKLGNADSAIYYAEMVLKDTVNHSIPVMLEAANILNDGYERQRNKDSMVKYLRFTSTLKDSLFGKAQARQVQNLTYNETLRQQEIADQRTRIEVLKKKNLLKQWFGGAIALIIIASLFAFYRYRIAQLMKLQAVRNDISRDLHDDIGSTLSSINILSGVAEMRMQNGQHDLSISALHKINAYSYEMVEKMSDIVWAIDPKNDSIGSLVARIKNAMAETCLQENITLIFDVDADAQKCQLSTTVRKNIYLICKEAINNAIRHACCSAITVKICMLEEGIKISITDDGKGFDPNTPATGNGLKNMRSRTEELHGTFAIESSQHHTNVIMCI